MKSLKLSSHFFSRRVLEEALEPITTVVDVTYLCNATCKYCQWGDKNNPIRKHLPLEETLITPKALQALGTERIVLSGGEPRLHPQLPKILDHYRRLVSSVNVISNGFGLDSNEVNRLTDNGATGFTVSLDSTISEEAMLTRETSSKIHRQVISNLKKICDQPRDFELGINSVVSSVTANWNTVSEILELGQKLGLDFVKFQPIFDDGYVGLNALHLMLSPLDSPKLLYIGKQLATIKHPKTNPPEFWKNIADLAMGRELSSMSCSLGSRYSIAVRNNLNICYWLNTISFGNTGSNLESETVLRVKREFELSKLKCRVDFHCFCTQNLFHVWKNRRTTEAN